MNRYNRILYGRSPFPTFALSAATLTVGLALISATCETSRADVIAPWTQFQADAVHSGYVPGTILGVPLPMWTASLPSVGEARFVQGVATDAEHVYVTAFNHTEGIYNYFYHTDDTYNDYDLLALNRANGTIQWSQRAASYMGAVSAPSIGDGRVYVHQSGSSNTSGGTITQLPRLVAVNAHDGGNRYDAPHEGQFSSSARPTVDAPWVYTVGGLQGGLDGYFDGSRNWSVGLPNSLLSDFIPAVDSQNVYVYMGGLRVYNRSTGVLNYTISNPNDSTPYIPGTPSLGGQHDAIVGLQSYVLNSELISFDLSTHGVRWQAFGNYHAFAIRQGEVFAADANKLIALDEATGQVERSWTAPIAGSLSGNLLTTDNVLIVGATNGSYGIDLLTMTQVWFIPLAGDLSLGNNLLVISSNQRVDAFQVPEPGTISLLVSGVIACVIAGGLRGRRLPGRRFHACSS